MRGKHRSQPAEAVKRHILKRQRGKCAYCGVKLDTWRYSNGKAVFSKLHWDHVVPFAFTQTNDVFVAACDKCNLKKSDLHLVPESLQRTFSSRMQVKRRMRAHFEAENDNQRAKDYQAAVLQQDLL